MRRWNQIIMMGTSIALVATGCGTQSKHLGEVRTPVRRHHRHQASVRPVKPSVYKPKSTKIPINANVSSPATGLTSKQPGFPTIIQMAMQQMPSTLKKDAVAPTLIPWPNTGSKVMYYAPLILAPGAGGLQRGYQVTLSSPLSPVALYATRVYASDQAVRAAMAPLMSVAGVSYPTSGTAVNIGSAIVALGASDGATHVLGWREGQWMVVVAEASHSPIHTASAVAAYLHTAFLPAPKPVGSGMGLILINLVPDGAHTLVAWQENQVGYQVKTYPDTANPVMTALKMVVTIRQYVHS